MTTKSTGATVELDRVSRWYDRHPAIDSVALSDVSLSVPSASVLAVVGPSGSGKSTLLHVIGTMDRPDAGAIFVNGADVTTLSSKRQSEYRRTIGFVFQRFHLLPALTALDNVVAPLLPYKTSFDKFEKGRHVLAAVGLAGREAAMPSQLSRGEEQRVAIARAIINEPTLLLADEPTGNLDSETGTDIVDLLLDLRGQYGVTVILATHDPVVATRCDRIVTLQDGRVVEDIELRARADPDYLLGDIGRFQP